MFLAVNEELVHAYLIALGIAVFVGVVSYIVSRAANTPSLGYGTGYHGSLSFRQREENRALRARLATGLRLEPLGDDFVLQGEWSGRPVQAEATCLAHVSGFTIDRVKLSVGVAHPPPFHLETSGLHALLRQALGAHPGDAALDRATLVTAPGQEVLAKVALRGRPSASSASSRPSAGSSRWTRGGRPRATPIASGSTRGDP